MVKLLDILLESIEESKTIKLDKSVIPQIEEIYRQFMVYYEDNDSMEYLKNIKKPIKLGRIKFNNQYNPNFKGVSVWLVYDKNKDLRGSYSSVNGTIAININSDVGEKKSNFTNTLYHELVHAVDPKLTDKKVSNSYYDKQAKKYDKDVSSGDFVKYLKKPSEFDAWSSTFINKVEDGMSKLQENDPDLKELKSGLKVMVNDLLGELKKHPNSGLDETTILKIAEDFVDKHIKYLGLINELIFDLEDEMTMTFILNIFYYLNKPSLYKKYVQRLSRLL